MTAIGDSFLTIIAGGIEIAVRLTPKGGRDAVDGVEHLSDGRAVLKVRVRAPPADGAANTALLRMMAHALGVAHRDVELAAGATSRIKRLRISGDAAALTARLREISKVKA